MGMGMEYIVWLGERMRVLLVAREPCRWAFGRAEEGSFETTSNGVDGPNIVGSNWNLYMRSPFMRARQSRKYY